MIHNTKYTMKEVLLSAPCYIAPRSEFDENEEELSKALNYYLDADTFIKL